MRLTRREKSLAIASAIFLGVWILFMFLVRPALARIETLTRIVPEKQSELTRLRAKSTEYTCLRKGLQGLRAKAAAQDQTFELLPLLESLMRESGLAKNLVAMNRNILPLDQDYQEAIVEIKLESLTLRQLVDFLAKIEGSSQVFAKTKSLYIRRNPSNTDLLDPVIELHSLKLTQTKVASR